MLSQFCCRKMLSFYMIKDNRITCRSDFKNHENIFRKMFHWKIERVEFPLCMSRHLLPQRNFSKTIHIMTWSFTPPLSKFPSHPCWSLLCHFLCSWHNFFYPSLLPYDFTHVYFSKLPTFFLIFCLILEPSFSHFLDS